MSRIQLLEDDESIASSLKTQLSQLGFETQLSTTLSEFRNQDLRDAHVFILDIGLPDGSGFDVVSDIRKASQAPIIFMTALNSAENRLRGYELGAHEFIPKPFHFKELLLRLRHVLNGAPLPQVAVSLPGGNLDLEKMCFESKTGEISFIAVKDFRVLQMLISESPRPVTRDQLLDHVWGEDKFPSQRTIDNSIVRLRQMIGDEGGAIIRSIRGLGYQWVLDKEKKDL